MDQAKKNRQEARAYESLKTEIHAYKETYRQIKALNQQLHMIKHDDIAMNRMLVQLIQNGQYEEAMRLLGKMEQSLEQVQSVMTDNVFLDYLLNNYLAFVGEKGLDLKIFIEHNLRFMNEYDLLSLVSNLMDNAIKAAEETEKKRIEFTIRKTTDLIVLIVKNTSLKPFKETAQMILRNEYHGGFGILKIKALVKKYGAEFIMYNDEDWVVSKVIFKK